MCQIKYVGGVCEEEEALLWMAKDDGITPNHMVLRCFVDEICGPHKPKLSSIYPIGNPKPTSPTSWLHGFLVESFNHHY